MRLNAIQKVDLLGLEPRTTEPKSAVLPITPWVYIRSEDHFLPLRVQRYNENHFCKSSRRIFFCGQEVDGRRLAYPPLWGELEGAKNPGPTMFYSQRPVGGTGQWHARV